MGPNPGLHPCRASLRDATVVAAFDPWVEPHGYRRPTARRWLGLPPHVTRHPLPCSLLLLHRLEHFFRMPAHRCVDIPQTKHLQRRARRVKLLLE